MRYNLFIFSHFLSFLFFFLSLENILFHKDNIIFRKDFGNESSKHRITFQGKRWSKDHSFTPFITFYKVDFAFLCSCSHFFLHLPRACPTSVTQASMQFIDTPDSLLLQEICIHCSFSLESSPTDVCMALPFISFGHSQMLLYQWAIPGQLSTLHILLICFQCVFSIAINIIWYAISWFICLLTACLLLIRSMRAEIFVTTLSPLFGKVINTLMNLLNSWVRWINTHKAKHSLMGAGPK